jgi:hypothetical protein
MSFEKVCILFYLRNFKHIQQCGQIVPFSMALVLCNKIPIFESSKREIKMLFRLFQRLVLTQHFLLSVILI